MLLGLVAIFALFQWVASATGSVRGEAGVLVSVIVVAATLITERYLFGESFRASRKINRPRSPESIGNDCRVCDLFNHAFGRPWSLAAGLSLWLTRDVH